MPAARPSSSAEGRIVWLLLALRGGGGKDWTKGPGGSRDSEVDRAERVDGPPPPEIDGGAAVM